jgi:hypothetical protein
VAKKRILMKVSEPTVSMQQSPVAAYYVQQNMESGGTKISSLGSQSYASDRSKLGYMELDDRGEMDRGEDGLKAEEKVKLQWR